MNSFCLGNGDIINVGSGENYSVNEIANFFNSEVVYRPIVLEPKETLACIEKAKYFKWEPETSLKNWIKQ
jgi:nucleoside-diphosphate-sugar epimerase